MRQKSMGESAIYLTLRTAAILSILLASLGSPQAQEGTAAQRHACRPDAFRLCGEFIPDRTAITKCLQKNKARLSPDCRAVFNGKLK